jgi:hypothetical protein
MAQERDQWQDLIKKEVNFRVIYKATIAFSRTLLRGVPCKQDRNDSFG